MLPERLYVYNYIHMQKTTLYHGYIYFVFFVKLLFLFAIFAQIYARFYAPDKLETAQSWKDYFENIFIILMAILLVYLFSHSSVRIEREERVLFVIFAIIIILHTYRML